MVSILRRVLVASAARLLPVLAAAGTLGIASDAAAQLMMPDSTNNRMVYFDPFDGSVVNPNAFALAGGTPIHAMAVGGEIWVSEQVGDRVSRWDINGNSLGAITGAMDNIRGMGLVNNVVYVTNAGTANGAPGAALRMFDPLGNDLGHFVTPQSPSPFGVLDHQGGLLVSSSSANDDMHRWSYGGASLGTFHNSTAINFPEQMNYSHSGDILVAVFSSNIVARMDPNTGAVLSSFPASGARGVIQLGNGNVLWSSGTGAFVFDVNTNTSTLVYSGGGRYFDVVPEPGTLAMLGLAGLLGLSRRRD